MKPIVPASVEHRKCHEIAKLANRQLVVNEYRIDCPLCSKKRGLILQPWCNKFKCNGCYSSGDLDWLLQRLESNQWRTLRLMQEGRGVKL